MKTSRKPSKRTINRIACETAGHLRELVAAFCRRHDGVMVRDRMAAEAPFGTFGADWEIPTRFGTWTVHEPSDPATGLVSINTRFDDPDALTAAIDGYHVSPTLMTASFNRHSGKWNHNAEVNATNDPKAFAEAFILDFEHRSAFIFQERSDAARCDQRVASGLPTDGDGARRLGATRDKVGGQRRVPPARVAGDDQDGVLAQHVAQVGREALGLRGERGAPTAIVLRAEDVEGQAGLALAEEDARRGCDGIAGEVAVRGGRDRRRRLLRVDGAPERRPGQRAALAEADDDADRARGDRTAQGANGATSESHVLSLVHQRAAFKKWAAPNYVVIWFDGPGRLRLTVEHVDAIRGAKLAAAGWREVASGRYRRTVRAHELAMQLALVGAMYATETV